MLVCMPMHISVGVNECIYVVIACRYVVMCNLLCNVM